MSVPEKWFCKEWDFSKIKVINKNYLVFWTCGFFQSVAGRPNRNPGRAQQCQIPQTPPPTLEKTPSSLGGPSIGSRSCRWLAKIDGMCFLQKKGLLKVHLTRMAGISSSPDRGQSRKLDLIKFGGGTKEKLVNSVFPVTWKANNILPKPGLANQFSAILRGQSSKKKTLITPTFLSCSWSRNSRKAFISWIRGEHMNFFRRLTGRLSWGQPDSHQSRKIVYVYVPFSRPSHPNWTGPLIWDVYVMQIQLVVVVVCVVVVCVCRWAKEFQPQGAYLGKVRHVPVNR